MINGRVLLVDDEPDIILTLKITLEENGFKVDSFTDPLSALQNFKEYDGMYDMVILDIRMPNMNGFELYRQIKKIDDKAKVCFLTASEMSYGATAYEDIFNSLDAKYFIQKPIENEKLIARLNKIK
jgi:two-component system catabolic regulation response regulator CreB/two-component system response regulator ChvI